jgi:hypothetical protein
MGGDHAAGNIYIKSFAGISKNNAVFVFIVFLCLSILVARLNKFLFLFAPPSFGDSPHPLLRGACFNTRKERGCFSGGSKEVYFKRSMSMTKTLRA